MKSTHSEILKRVKRGEPGDMVFPVDFRGLGPDAAIRMSLSRLAKEGVLERIAHGIYMIPKEHPELGKLLPSAQHVANELAKRERVRILPTGSYALNILGLSEQVPMQQTYITDGQSRMIAIGKGRIRFKGTTHKKLSLKGRISSLVILGLEELDLKKLTPNEVLRIRELLEKEDPKILQHDLKLARANVHDFIYLLNLNNKKP